MLASHCLEHIANPIKAIFEWRRVLKPRGSIVLILPEKSFTFDHRRQITSFDHLLEDFNTKVDESDLTHLDEILELSDISRDQGSGTKKEYKDRSILNFENRSLHHHVFDISLVKRLLDFCNFNVVHIGQKGSDIYALALERSK